PPVGALEQDLGAGTPAPEAPAYQARYREALAAGSAPPEGLEQLRGAGQAARAAQWAQAVQHTLLLFVPRVTPQTFRPGLLSALNDLAERGVMMVMGWGAAETREAETAQPAPDVLDTLSHLHGPEGLPAAVLWWVGGLYGQDVVADQARLACSVPNLLVAGDQAIPAGVSTYLVSAPEWVG